MINPASLFKMKQAKDTFVQNHPKFPKFLEAVRRDAIKEGTIIEINVTTPEGKTLSSNIKLKETDIEALHELLKKE
ncbi:hypothetical protein [Konateibacter massiliensis]|uniref:hypothetical protein n=1 Tax=Konateibacter massiliensis TaxID=2002841 RepID=UPI000C159609|nr:hypothetical protein [Konateibacter massiliensis]